MVSPLPELVSLDRAQRHLRLGDEADLEDLATKVEQATAIVLDYLDRNDDDWTETMVGWTKNTVPRHVQAAILLQLGELYRFRGDDDLTGQPKRDHGALLPAVAALLHRMRDPSLS